MAKITTPSYVTGISGKVCKHEGSEYRTNSSSGKIILSKKCHPYQGPATQLQMDVRNAFSVRHNAVLAWLDENRPTKENPKGTALYQEAIRIKKQLMLDNVQSALSQYQKREAPYEIKLPSEGGVRQKGNWVVSDNNSGNSQGGGNTQQPTPNTPSGGGSTTRYSMTLSADPSLGGSVQGAGEYRSGEVANISATANSGYKFLRWSDGNTSASRSVTMSEDKVLTAQFQVDSEGSDNSGW